jgi:hypothetical protein
MLCEHLKELHHFVEENHLEIGGLDMIRLVCKKCQVQHECPEVSTEYWIKEIEQEEEPRDNSEQASPQ